MCAFWSKCRSSFETKGAMQQLCNSQSVARNSTVARDSKIGKALGINMPSNLMSFILFPHAAIVSFLVSTLIYKLSRYYSPLIFKSYSGLSRADQREWDVRWGQKQDSFMRCDVVIVHRSYPPGTLQCLSPSSAPGTPMSCCGTPTSTTG